MKIYNVYKVIYDFRIMKITDIQTINIYEDIHIGTLDFDFLIDLFEDGYGSKTYDQQENHICYFYNKTLCFDNNGFTLDLSIAIKKYLKKQRLDRLNKLLS